MAEESWQGLILESLQVGDTEGVSGRFPLLLKERNEWKASGVS